MVPIYAAKGGILELGGEFFPLNTRDFLFSYPVPILGSAILIAANLIRAEKTRFETRVLFWVSFPLALGSLLSQRYMIHGYPLVLIWLACQFSDWMKPEAKIKGPIWIALAFLCFATVDRVRADAAVEQAVNSHYESAARWMRENIPPGEVIFHANWSDSQYFIGMNPQDDYFVTLDPIYMYAWDPRIYELYRNVAHGRMQDPYPALKTVFGVRYGYAGRNYFSPFISQISQDKRFKILAEDGLGVIFEIK